MARQLGLSGSPVITMIVNGKRHPGRGLVAKLNNFFGFSQPECAYFEDLVRLEKVNDDPELSVLLMERLARKHSQGTFRFLDDVTFSTIAKWYYYAIREMVSLADFEESPAYISSRLRFKVTPTEVKKVLGDLLQAGLLVREQDGSLIQSTPRVTTSNDISSEALTRFHEGMIEKARTSVRTVSILERELQGPTLGITSDALPMAKAAIRKFKNEFESMFEESRAEEVYQLNLQFFPLTQKIRGTE